MSSMSTENSSASIDSMEIEIESDPDGSKKKTNFNNYNYRLYEPECMELLKLTDAVPQNILEIIQDEETDCDIFAAVVNVIKIQKMFSLTVKFLKNKKRDQVSSFMEFKRNFVNVYII
ncbi:unnamed protein product [Rhizophagus irregularis]|nr:unnamed protein product [Rhizophagus irregularis]